MTQEELLDEALGTTTEEPAAEEPEEAPAEVAAEPPPPPVEPPPVQESLAEQVAREAREVPESTGPSDYVPNRPNIRPPDTYQPAEEEVEGGEPVEGEEGEEGEEPAAEDSD